jgi:hypothetical protein
MASAVPGVQGFASFVVSRYTGDHHLIRVASARAGSPNMHSQTSPTRDEVIARTRNWLERAVIGLNLCPFAKGVHAKGQIRYVVSPAHDDESLLDDLQRELLALCATPAEEIDTTLLIHPWALTDFADFLRFLDLVEVVLRTHRLHGVLQVASFHPDYVFADSAADDITNCTNRSPFPTLHLLREASLDRAVAAFPEASLIYERNLRTLRQLGDDGWRALGTGSPPLAKE